MVFTSYTYLFIFFPICVIGYLLIYFIQNKCIQKFGQTGFRICDIYLLLASLGFYSWSGLKVLLFLTGYIVLTYILGRIIEKSSRSDTGTGETRKKTVAVSVAVLILTGILFLYKYINFTFEIVGHIVQRQFDVIELIVPLGISFITFSAISYVVDIYRGDAGAGSILDAALYLAFFPKVVSGPIVLWKDFEPQLRKRILDEQRFADGLNRIVAGYAKKVILADSFGAIVNDMQYNLSAGAGMDVLTSWACAFLYMLQIYYDFAGYSDIAIGTSSLFGFSVKENFQFPYVSASITEFWRRWHISLGTWFREYIYIPLGGNRKGSTRTLVNLFIVFLVTGIWHGAGWNYIIWGVLNGVCVVVERCISDKKWYCKMPYILKWAFTMLIVLFSWEIFRMQSVSEIVDFIKVMLGITRFPYIDCTYAFYLTPKVLCLMGVAVIGATLPHKKCFCRFYEKMNQSKGLFVLKECVVFLLMALTMMFLVNSTYSPFIYFQY